MDPEKFTTLEQLALFYGIFQGLKVGDKILEVNGHSFYGITHAEAVMIMRNAWNMIMYIESSSEEENLNLKWPEGKIMVLAW